jgi:predicted ATPase/DNA-binding winged helix-turn-helix (wHTH) protein
MGSLSDRPAVVEFGRFRVVPHRRQLLADGRAVVLGGRSFDLLMALIEVSGAVVGKDALLRRIWPNRIVDENRLQGEISTLRRAFGPDRNLIQTVAGRGYQFTGEIRAGASGPTGSEVPSAPVAEAAPRTLTNLLQPVSELIGRGTELSEVLDLVTNHRLVTLIGEGGIGKTRLGLEVGRHLLAEFADGVWVAEFAPLSDPDLVPVTVATTLGVEFAGGTVSTERIANALGAKRLLLILDNCEHVVAAAAGMAEALLRGNSIVRVLATSREPLQVEGECLYRVPPLTVPSENNDDVEELLRQGAVQLFVARMQAQDPSFSPHARNATAAATICRRLDGIPLAIELAAACGGALGIEELASRLDDRFHLLTGGRRMALPRHQTLRGTLDWSYELLTEPERVVLRRLAIFAGGFTLTAASAVVISAAITASDVVDTVANLVTKSLVAADIGSTSTRYRLLETTRAYALEKLAESCELGPVSRCHAEYYRDLFERAEAEWQGRLTPEWVADYTRELDNVRAALDWAFSPRGDPCTGVALTVSSVPLWMQLSLLAECRRHVERALRSLGSVSSRNRRDEMRLYSALARSLFFTTGAVQETSAAWVSALTIAEEIADTDYQLQGLYGLWNCGVFSGEFRTARAFAERFCGLAAKTRRADVFIGDRLIGFSLHYLGYQNDARYHIERMLAGYDAAIQRSHTARLQMDQQLAARNTLARILWLQGFPDQAVHTALSNLEDARAIDHPLSLCNVLADAACPLALFTGDLMTAGHFVTLLLDHSAKHSLDVWNALGRVFEAVLLIQRGEVIVGLPRLSAALDVLRETGFLQRYTMYLGALAHALAVGRRPVEGLATIDEALARIERFEDRWCLAELLRIKGRLFMLKGAPEAAAVVGEDHFLQALEWARRQEALSWELRAATSLAQLYRDQDRTKDGYELLAPVYGRFTEGLDTADLKTARALLNELQ